MLRPKRYDVRGELDTLMSRLTEIRNHSPNGGWPSHDSWICDFTQLWLTPKIKKKNTIQRSIRKIPGVFEDSVDLFRIVISRVLPRYIQIRTDHEKFSIFTNNTLKLIVVEHLDNQWYCCNVIYFKLVQKRKHIIGNYARNELRAVLN